jgi:hypothetical protein
MMQARPTFLGCILLSFGLFAGSVGCQHCDVVESELRAREDELRTARAELEQAMTENAALRSQLAHFGPNASAKVSPEQTASVCPVKQIVLGRQTGGYDEDKDPGDEALQVVIEPRDGGGRVVKVAGSLHLAVLQITPEGLKKPLSSWDLSPEQLQPTWRSGLLSTGYHVVVPWKTWPSSERLRIVAQFTLADGHAFEADRDVTVRLPPPAYRKPLAESQPNEALGPELPSKDTPPAPARLRPQPVQPLACWHAPSTGAMERPAALGRPVPVQ